ncbi:MAG: prolipoprotein diacylglyceryl transferase [Bacteroidales bacterium]|nr:prolipoprotein diacylglyceryl transferase [Bacteroidales bacterium]
MLNYILWNVDPGIFTVLGREIRWYGLLFALSFYLASLILDKILQKKGMDQKQVSKLIIYLIVGCIVGLRLGHCLFYEPGYYLSNPLEILKIWKGGLASHGAAVGILIALYLFVRKTNRSYFWLLDRIVITVLFIAPFIRTGNLMNSEIIGDKSGNPLAFIFVRGVDDELSGRHAKFIEDTRIRQTGNDTVVDNTHYTELNLEVYFKKNIPEDKIDDYLYRYFVQRIDRDEDLRYNVKLFTPEPEVVVTEDARNYKAVMSIYGIPRHPSQVYETLAYLIFFLVFFFYYNKRNGMIREGFIFGMFLICVFGFRFFVEFFKEVQVPFENSIMLNMGQLLSLPLVLLGVFMVLRSRGKKAS